MNEYYDSKVHKTMYYIDVGTAWPCWILGLVTS